MKLRNMTAIYILHQDSVLLIHKTRSRVFCAPLWCGVGGHFEQGELNDPEACILRELAEETALRAADLRGLRLKYVTLRKKDDELRQQYVYFAELARKDVVLPPCDEGELAWKKQSELDTLAMSYTNARCLVHYFLIGKHDQNVYIGVVSAKGGLPAITFTPVQDFSTAY